MSEFLKQVEDCVIKAAPVINKTVQQIKLRNLEKEIGFHEGVHKYYHGDKQYISVTTIVGHFAPFFDPTGAIAKSCAVKEGCEVADIKRKWKLKGKIAAERGTVVHAAGEFLLNSGNPDLSDDIVINKELDCYDSTRHEEYKQYIAAMRSFIKDEGVKDRVFATEAVLFSKAYQVAGQADFLIWNDDGSIDIGDWKTNEKISDYAYNKTLYGGLSHLDDSTLVKYNLQLSIYKYMLINEGFKVNKTYLVHVKPDGTYNKIVLDYMPAEAEYILKSNLLE